jgi:acetamidase/formamidase
MNAMNAKLTSARKPLGRRSLLTPVLQKRICDLLAQGNTILTVCHSVGIAEKTFYTWSEERPQFSQATTRARGKARIKLVKTLSDASKIDWRAAAWLLSHCWPSEFSELVRQEIGLVGGVVLIPSKSAGPE